MRNFRPAYYLLFLTMILLSLTALSQDKSREMQNLSSFRQKLTAATRQTNSIESSFAQEKSLSVLTETIISKGKFYFKKTNQLRWEYTSPFNYLIILNNGKILIKDDEKERHFDARSNKVFSEINEILLGCAQGTLLNDEKRFRASYFETSGSFLVKLQPREQKLKEIFSEICLYFDKNDYSVSKLILNEPSGDYTSISFSGKKLNSTIPDEKFRLP